MSDSMWRQEAMAEECLKLLKAIGSCRDNLEQAQYSGTHYVPSTKERASLLAEAIARLEQAKTRHMLLTVALAEFCDE